MILYIADCKGKVHEWHILYDSSGESKCGVDVKEVMDFEWDWA